ncbi:MAG: hypothetical protein GF317_22440 [Candidatus Lokiarchaeota archaeon]|nr:hypothetical protein [Candidatus Lokiarchaeota archaeon]MBD3202220.1 hypothetical protein [Candidatus Lokiarchaeota archaeon]
MFCEFCGDEIPYLPFKCKYCGGTYCKEHRLPENHDCTFEKKHIPVVPTTSRGKSPKYAKTSTEKYSTDSKKVRKYLKKQEKQRRKARRTMDRGFSGTKVRYVSTPLIIIIFIASIVAFIIPQYLCLNYYSYFGNFFWTFFTAPFVSYSDSYFGIFFLFIIVILFYNMVRLIEIRFGRKFLLTLFFLGTVLSGLIYTAIYLPIELSNSGFAYISIFTGLAYGGLLAIISFLLFFSLNREMTFLIFFIPVKMKGKMILLLLILIRLIPGLLFGLLFNPIYYAVYLSDLGGILASYLVFKYKFRYLR